MLQELFEKIFRWITRAPLNLGLTLLAAVGLSVGLTLAISASENPTGSAASTGSSNKTVAASPTPPEPAHVGTTVAIGENRLLVTILNVTDQAKGANQYVEPKSGNHFVSVTLKVNNNTTGNLRGNANSEVNVIGSDGQSYTPSFEQLIDCSNFSYGSYQLTSGTETTGCVGFNVPNGVTVTKVLFTPQSGVPAGTTTWLVP